MKWMEPFLQDGRLSGKIVCPNKKCSAKLGNYDWAGVCCGCKEWVVPVCVTTHEEMTVQSNSLIFFRVSASIGQKLTRSRFEMLCGYIYFLARVLSISGFLGAYIC
jgi:hypothetical protein